ncbi:GNAT family N-acetyltransferase [Nitrincola sp.]|uniref:GNAT family N-acetyltransferase n=1 Tax=Nitrincola sp. TaxID=1926584 RepID=UPI003A916426
MRYVKIQAASTQIPTNFCRFAALNQRMSRTLKITVMNMSEFEIKTLTPEDWEIYKSARLKSLRDSPDSFGSTYDQESALSDAEWQTRLNLKLRALDALPLVAKMDGQPVGLAWGVIHEPDLGVAHIYQMWVSPALRGKGIATSLLREIKAWAAGRGCEFVALAVTNSNQAAVSLYMSSGFIATGQLEELRSGSAIMVQPMVMKLSS